MVKGGKTPLQLPLLPSDDMQFKLLAALMARNALINLTYPHIHSPNNDTR